MWRTTQRRVTPLQNTGTRVSADCLLDKRTVDENSLAGYAIHRTRRDQDHCGNAGASVHQDRSRHGGTLRAQSTARQVANAFREV
jgi:hypothetical protein